MREIETFIKYRGRENILAVLAEGEPETAFPAALLEAGEPLAADVRGKSKRQVLRHLKERMPRLAAPLLHCSYDELYQRHRVYKMRRLAAAAGAVAALSLGFGAVTVSQNRRITENYQGKLENQSQYLAWLSADLLAHGDREAALLVAREALPGEGGDRPYVAEARIALENALYLYSMDMQYTLRPMKVLEHKGIVQNSFDYDPGEGVLLTRDTRAYLWDEETLGLIACWDDGTAYTDAKLAGGGRLLLLWEQGVRCVDFRSGTVLWEWQLPPCAREDCTASSTLLWDYCKETETLLCMESSPTTHRLPPDYEGPQIADRHGIHLIDTKTGTSRVWKPAEVYAPLLEESAPMRFVRTVKFSPDGSRLAIAWWETSSWEIPDAQKKSGICFRVLTPDTDDCLLREDAENADTVDGLTWLPDGAPFVVFVDESDKSIGVMGFSAPWQAVCWNPDSWERRFMYEDHSLRTTGQIITQTAEVFPSSAAEPTEVVTLIIDNVAVNLDLHTGECYSRMEDRKGLLLNHTWQWGLQMLVTSDGYVFTTTALEDRAWNPTATAYQYSLDLGTIDRAEWLGERVYLFTQTAVYCYSGVVDDSYSMLGRSIKDYGYNSAHTRLSILDYENTFALYDTADFSLLWQEECADSYFGRGAALLDDTYAAWVDPAWKGVRLRAISGADRTGFIPLTLTEGGAYRLEPGGPGRAILLLKSSGPTFSQKSQQAPWDAKNTALWLLDAEGERVVCQWSWQQLADALPIPQAERPAEFRVGIAGAGVTASGRYLLIACTADSGPFSSLMYEETSLLAWDLEEERWLALPQSLCRNLTDQLGQNTFFSQDGWLAPEGDVILLYIDKTAIAVADISTGEELCRLTVDGVASQEITFTPDGEHILFQDGSLRLQAYNWKTGEYTQSAIAPETGSMRFEFGEDGAVLSAVIKVASFYSDTAAVYRKIGPGEYQPETRIDRCSGCDGHTVIKNEDNLTRLYHYCSLDELLAKTAVILNGRELTELERENYLID